MRLLESDHDNGFRLTRNFIDDVPPYAILSHTWGSDMDEVTFQDMIDGTGKDKVGYSKVRFCGEQAKRDGLQYFWVDTCCINKSDITELSEAINSMFYWYRDASRCYVYLADVSRPLTNDNSSAVNLPCESAFRRSRWFTRGWTLQELIAPISVEFFDNDCQLIGNKKTLERYICDITGIPAKALQGNDLSDFTVTERFAWAENRETTRKEDIAYSLLGIFNIHMPLIYGEGKEHAFRRLREEIERASKGNKHEDFSATSTLAAVMLVRLIFQSLGL